MTVSTNPIFGPSLLAQLNGTNSSSNPSAATSKTGAGSGALTQLDFLKLMMQQLQNQDPTKPMDESAIMGQLAQFGTVSGIASLNTSFSTLSSQLVSNQALQASSLLGHNVLVTGSAAPLAAGGRVAGAVNVPSSANGVTVEIVNAAGAVVKTISLGNEGAGLANFSWDGSTDAGTTAPPGTYGVLAGGSVAGKGQQFSTLVSAQVTSITLNGASGSGGLTLHLAGIGDVPFSAVQQID